MSRNKAIRSHEYFIIFLFFCSSSAANVRFEQESIESFLIYDFVKFHDIHLVNIISQGVHDQANDWWRKGTFRLLISEAGIGLSVLETQPHHVNGNSSARKVPHFRNLANLIQCSQHAHHLVIQQIVTEEDLSIFRELYQEAHDKVNWLILSDATIEDRLNQVYIPVNSKVIVALVEPNSRNATFLEAYKVAPKLPIRLHAIGKWLFNSYSSDNSLRKNLPFSESLLLDEFKDLPNQRLLAYRRMKHGIMAYIKGDLIMRRRDLTGLHLKCTTIDAAPFLLIKRIHPDGTVSLQGSIADVFYLLQKVTNFSSTCRMVRDKTWGTFLNGRWNGVIGEVVEGTADIAVTAIDMTPKRSEVVDFLMEVATTSYSVVFKRASSSDQRWAAYTREFQENAWIIFGIFCILLVLLFVIFAALSPLRSHLSPTDAVHLAVGFLLGQGTSISVSATSLRMLMLTSLMFHVLMLTHYTSDLMSGLAAGDPRLPISDLTDIAENPKFTLAFSKSTSMDEYLSKSPVAAHQKIWQDSQDRGSAAEQPLQDVLEYVLTKQDYFSILSKEYFLYTSGNDCRFLPLKRDYFPTGMSLALKKNSPIKPILNNLILGMYSSGILEKIARKAKAKRAACEYLEVAPIGLSSVMAPLSLLGSGVIVSCLFLLLELVVAKRRAVP